MTSAPALPADVVAAFDAAASMLDTRPDARQREALLEYLALLVKWNRVYNLTAVRDPRQMVTQHLLDSLVVVAPLRRWAGGAPIRLLDVGSGGGLPGVVIATMLPAFDVTCVDAVGKKVSFVREVAGALRLDNLHAEQARIEALQCAPFDVVVSRAFASLADFVALTHRHLAAAGVWMAMKGKAPADEMAALPVGVDVFHVEPLHVPGLHAERCLVWMRPR